MPLLEGEASFTIVGLFVFWVCLHCVFAERAKRAEPTRKRRGAVDSNFIKFICINAQYLSSVCATSELHYFQFFLYSSMYALYSVYKNNFLSLLN